MFIHIIFSLPKSQSTGQARLDQGMQALLPRDTRPQLVNFNCASSPRANIELYYAVVNTAEAKGQGRPFYLETFVQLYNN